jgi:hypothetical protein
MGKGIDIGQLLEFKVAFPNEEPQTVDQYLSGGSRDVILNVSTFFLGFKSFDSKYEDNKTLLQTIFCPENEIFAKQLYSRIRAVENEGIKVGIINTYSGLKLFEYFFSRPDEPETQSHAEFERNLFKAYIVLNTEFTKSQHVAFSSTANLADPLKIPAMLFSMHYPASDKENFDIKEIWATQIIKAIYLFESLESNFQTQPLLNAFLVHFEQPTWQEYLKSLLALTNSAILNDKEAHSDIIVTQGEEFEKSCNFIEKLIIHDNDELKEDDFVTIRERPFYKISDGVYRIIFNLFVVEKIFKGVYFLLNGINKSLPEKDRITALKGFYCYEFSEKILLYRILEIIYPSKCLKYTGKELSDSGIDGAPDYYVRKGKQVLLFESKDFLIRADLKASFDFNIYDEEFGKRLYYETQPNGSEKAGAVMQLIKFIKAILKNSFSADKDYYYKDLHIYPILITHDHQYDTTGFNDCINSWFQDELEILEEEGYFIHRIKPLTVVNIDSLIFYQVSLADRHPLHLILDAYHKFISIRLGAKHKSLEDAKSNYLSKRMPFALFIHRYFHKLGIKSLPPIMDTVAPALFSEELENRGK